MVQTKETPTNRRITTLESTRGMLGKYTGQGKIPKAFIEGDRAELVSALQICALADFLTGKTENISFNTMLYGLTYEEAARALRVTFKLIEGNPQIDTRSTLVDLLTSAYTKKRGR